MSKLATAKTIPVTNAGQQKNSRKLLMTLAMMSTPVLRQRPMALPRLSAPPYRDQIVAVPARINDFGSRCGDGATLRVLARMTRSYPDGPPWATCIGKFWAMRGSP